MLVHRTIYISPYHQTAQPFTVKKNKKQKNLLQNSNFHETVLFITTPIPRF